VEPTSTIRVAAGPRTEPAERPEATLVTAPATKPRPARSAFASSSLLPKTAGTPISAVVIGLVLPEAQTAASANVRVSPP
jgi:hypothetical protein